MKRSKNLERAIVLGLLLSTSVYGSAWATDVDPISNNSHNTEVIDGVVVKANTTGDEEDAIGNIILRDTNQYTVTIATTGGNIEFEKNDGSGILVADGIASGTKVTLNASGDIIIDAQNGIQANAKPREDNNVSVISLTAKNNKITASDVGIYSTGKVDVLLTADSNEIISTGNYGIQATASSDGNLTLIATKGDNTVEAEKGTAIRANGEKVIKLEANNGNNIVIGGKYGIENTEIDTEKMPDKIYTDLDAVNNTIYGADSAIKSDGVGITDINASESNTIGQYKDEKNNVHTSDNGIYVTEGIVNLNAGNENYITATKKGIYASGQNSQVDLNGDVNNKIIVHNTEVLLNKDSIVGLLAENEANIGGSNGSLVVNVETEYNDAIGIQARENGNVKFIGIDSAEIVVNNTNKAADVVGIYAGYTDITSDNPDKTSIANVIITSKKGIGITALNSSNSTNRRDAYAVKANKGGKINLTAYQGDIEISSGTKLNSYSIYGYGVAAYDNSYIDISANDGSIKITTGAYKNEDDKLTVTGVDNQGIFVNGVQGEGDATASVKLHAANDINVFTASKYGGTQHGALYVAGKGKVELTAGNIMLNALNEATNSKTYGVSIASSSDIVDIEAVKDINIGSEGGQSIAVSALKGQVDITSKTGNIKVSSYGKSTSSSAQGVSSNSGGSLYLTAKAGSIDIDVSGNANAAGIYNTGVNGDKTTTTIDTKNLNVYADNHGKGVVSTLNNAYGIWGRKNSDTLITTENGTYFGINTDADASAATNNGYGIYLESAASADVTSTYGDNIINVGVLSDSEGNITGVKNSGIQTGISVKGNNSEFNLSANSGSNIIKSIIGVETQDKGVVELIAGENNILESGEIFTDKETDLQYGKSYAINALSASNVTLDAGNTNSVYGAVYAKDANTNVDIKGTEGKIAQNNIYSNAYITDAGDLNDGRNVISSLYAQDGAKITLSGVNDIRTYADSNEHDDLERTVWAYKGALIDIDGATTISTDSYDKSVNSIDIAIVAGTSTTLTEEVGTAKVNVNYTDYADGRKSIIEGDILSAYAGDVTIAKKDSITKDVSSSGIVINGNLLAGNGGTMTVYLGNGQLTGRVDDYGDAGLNTGHGAVEGENSFFNPAFSSEIKTGGDITLNMDKGSHWTVTGQSWITELNTTDKAEDTYIDIASTKAQGLNANASALTIGTLKGSTQFYMNLDGDRSASDMLYIKNAVGADNTSTAHYDIYLQNSVTSDEINSDGTTTFNGLRFATVGEGSNVNFTVKSRDDGGAFNVEYTVDTDSYEGNSENTAYNSTTDGSANVEKPGNDSVDNFFGLTNTATEETPEVATNSIMLMAENEEAADNAANADSGLDEVTNFKIVARADEELNDTGETILNMSRANYSNAIYMDRLNKRLGEARYINDDPEEDEGMWVRIRHDRIGKDDAYRSQNTMYELGYDKKQDCDNGERRVGFAVDYMHGDTGYTDIAGKGEIDRYGLWLYDTWMGDKGHYVDYVAKWGHLDNDFEVYTMRNGDKVTGDYSNNVFSVSAEYGRKKDIGNDWYFEPQAQLQLARVTGADYTTNQGTKVSVDGINSLIGRAGFRIGKDFGEEKQSTLYFKADVLHEFLGDQDVYVMDKSTDNKWAGISYDNEGTWYDIGIGYAAMMSKSSYAFIDLEQSFGNDNDDTYQINAGVRWTF